MKNHFLIILTIFLIIISILFAKYTSLKKKNIEIKKFNSEYEFYNRDNLKGIDITTVINKATDNNEKYNVKKDKEGYYIEDENSIKIDVKMILNGKTYPMERIQTIGLEGFTEYFGEITFNCTNIEYHEENGKISRITFESTQY